MSPLEVSKFKIKIWATVVFTFYTRKQRQIYTAVPPGLLSPPGTDPMAVHFPL
jgi:hypothetical protein